MSNYLAGRHVGHYRLVRLIGHGGMSEVFEAETSDGKHVAVKIYTVSRKDDVSLRRRFMVEGRILSRMAHPNLAHIYDMGIDEHDNTQYLVMDLVLDAEGRSCTLADAQKAGKCDETTVELWYQQLCSALRYCHKHGIVHRDVKLNNVLLDVNGNAVLSDFGVAKVTDAVLRSELQVSTTTTGNASAGTRPVMGTFWYLAPEVRNGGEATPASDWYALGILFFRLLTGMWYEPSANAFELLAPYDDIWRYRLERLLSNNPADREPPTSEPPARNRKHLRAVATCLCVMAAITMAWFLGRDESGRFETGKHVALVFDTTNHFEFCACPTGTNNFKKISISVTRPYWLGDTPVTRRQWFNVRGETLWAWDGGEDAPITYVSREEMVDFCARLNKRFASLLPTGYEIRLPTLAEWRLAFRHGEDREESSTDGCSMRKVHEMRGWFGQGANGMAQSSSMLEFYRNFGCPVPMVTNIWPQFPPKAVHITDKAWWMKYSSQIPPVPVGLKPANRLGIHDMCGNCFECVADTCSASHKWGTEWGLIVGRFYGESGVTVTNPVERTGRDLVMTSGYLTPGLACDQIWTTFFDKMPHLGFRLCVGPAITSPLPIVNR